MLPGLSLAKDPQTWLLSAGNTESIESCGMLWVFIFHGFLIHQNPGKSIDATQINHLWELFGSGQAELPQNPCLGFWKHWIHPQGFHHWTYRHMCFLVFVHDMFFISNTLQQSNMVCQKFSMYRKWCNMSQLETSSYVIVNVFLWFSYHFPISWVIKCPHWISPNH